MKTFKLFSFQLFDKQGNAVGIPLIDSLIINKENEANTWLIEIFFDKEFVTSFEGFSKDEELKVEVIITNKENSPAVFNTKIISIKQIDAYASVLLEGKLSRGKNGYAEKLLESLMSTGLTGSDLLSAFQEEMREKKRRVSENKISQQQ